ncbi:MAG TPA: NUDIX domain-containing protein [Fodinibius sp.]|nr:NUDIX domain-containing protein [Fodinibius sp.]
MNVEPVFSHRLRLRVSGLLVENDAVLLARMRSPVTDEMVWIPPGGEVEFGEPMADALRREFLEETEVEVRVHRLLHIQELIKHPFHAVECYFEASRIKGVPSVGRDPELRADEQLIEEVAWVAIDELDQRPFVPRNLLAKLKHWEDRSAFEILFRHD